MQSKSQEIARILIEKFSAIGKIDDALKEHIRVVSLEVNAIPVEHISKCFDVSRQYTARPSSHHLINSYNKSVKPEADNQKKVAAKKWIRTDIVMGASDRQKELFRQHMIKLMRKNVLPKNPDNMKRFGILASEL